MKSLAFIIVGIWVSWSYSDIYAENLILSLLAPICLVGFCAALMGWLFLKLKIRGQSSDLSTFDDFGGDA